MEKEKIELIKFDEVGYFESADAVYAQRAEVEQLADELDIIMNESMKLNLEDMESCFKEGFCMGAELILELKSENIKEMLM